MTHTHNIPLKPDNSHFTDGQWQAIYDGGDNLLVSASAGSGKTTVLVQRVIEKIKAGINVDELLIVTYTEAAAKEMKQRIHSALQEAITKESEIELKQHFVHQLSLIPTANVSTLHAFCLQVIRKYYYLIDIDPVFRLLTDETEMILLKEDVWDELREELYESDQEIFYHLTANFSSDRSDEGLMRLIFALYDFARANPSPKGWLDSLSLAYQTDGSITQTPVYQEILKPNFLAETQQLINRGENFLRLVEGEKKFEKLTQMAQDELSYWQTILRFLSEDNLEDAYDYINNKVIFPTFSTPRNLEDEEKYVKDQAKNLRDQNKNIIEKWRKDFFAVPPKKMLAVMEESYELVAYMAKVAYRFDKAYSSRKKERNLVDFNDLEHFTLRILASFDGENWQGSEASTFYRSLFNEVLVDEYQDINKLQESILYWLRQADAEHGNLFMVGDVKQSIYSFRLADPTLFIDKYNKFGGNEGGRRIILAENFRSRHEVLDFTNLIFKQLMNPSVGQLDYDEAAELVNGYQDFPEDARFKTELLIFENSNEDHEGDEVEDVGNDFQIDDKTEGELRMVGNKIQSMVRDEIPIFDKKTKTNRPISYKDIVLLSPTKKNNLVLLDIFKDMGIPLRVNDTQNYFQATEIKIMISLLTIVDNPFQDIPLVSVLRSPIVGLKENDLALIRANYPNGYFYEAMCQFINKNKTNKTELLNKLADFHELFLEWRELARRQQLVELIWRIYQETGFLDYVGGMPAGKQRQANLHALYERATSYEEMSFKGLFQFVRFIEKMQSKDKDLAEPTDLSDEEDAVRVMTIHASKGLEFPVVFVLDLTRKFNLMDLNKPYIFDVDLGAGIHYIDDDRLRYRTLPFSGIRNEKRKKLLSEEMRKLYVALTRAEEKLILVGSYKDKETMIKKWSPAGMEEGAVLSDQLRLKSNNLMDWIGMSLMRHRSMDQYQTDYPTNKKITSVLEHPANFSITFYNLDDLRQISGKMSQVELEDDSEAITNQSAVVDLSAEEKSLLSEAKGLLDYHYEHDMATKTASYQSVSEIKRVFEDPDRVNLLTLDLSKETAQTVNRFAEDSLAKPNFLTSDKKLTAAEIGTGTHLVMQLISLDETPTKESLIALIDELVRTESLTQKLADEISLDHLLAFFQTEFGQLLLSRKGTVVREQPFSMLLPANQIFKEYPKKEHDQILIHGIIDGYYETDDELILYDFKTDHVMNPTSKEELIRIKQKYSGQLHLYKKALSEAKQKNVTGVKLILLSTSQIIDF